MVPTSSWGDVKPIEWLSTAILDNLAEYMVYYDPQMRIFWVNRTVAAAVGLVPEDLVGERCSRIWPRCSAATEGCPIVKACETGQVHNTEIATPDGRVWMVGGYPVRDAQGGMVGVVEVMKEVSDPKYEDMMQRGASQYCHWFETLPISLWEEDFSAIKRYVDQLRVEGVQDFRTYFEQHPEAVVQCAKLVKVVDVNKKTLEMYHARSKEAMLGALSQVLCKEAYDSFREELIALTKGNTLFEGEHVTRTLTGDKFHIYLRVSVPPRYEKTWAKVFVSILDITTRKKVEGALGVSEEQFKAQYKGIPIPTYTWRRFEDDFILIDYNDAAERSTEGKIATFLGKRASEMYHDMPETREELSRCFTEKISFKREGLYRLRSTGQWRHLTVSYAYVPPNLVMMHTEDITERKNAEMALKESEQKFRVISESTRVGLVILQDDLIKYANEAVARMIGYTQEEILHSTIQSFFKAVYRDDDLVLIQEQLQKKQAGIQMGVIPQYSIQLVTKTGELRWVEVFSKTILYRGRSADLVTIIDTTEQKRAEMALRESEVKYAALVEQATDGVFIEQDGRIMFANRALAQLSGYPLEALVGMPLLELVAPECREYVFNRARLRAAGKEVPAIYELKSLCKDGTIKDVEVSVAIIQYREKPASMAIVRDITARKVAETARRELEERRLNFIEITSHELRTPLTAIRGYTELLNTRGGEFDQTLQEQCFKVINRNIMRLQNLITGVSTLGQLERGNFQLKKKKIDIKNFLDEVLAPYQIQLGPQLEVKTSNYFGEGPVLINGDADRLHQVLGNLLENAIKHTPPDQRQLSVILEVLPAVVRVRVVDNGAGIAPNDLEYIFEPFVSIPTEYSVGGAGIGLYLSRRIVEAHGGVITAQSEGMSRGATFILEFPRQKKSHPRGEETY